jgi:hypothetical protein
LNCIRITSADNIETLRVDGDVETWVGEVEISNKDTAMVVPAWALLALAARIASRQLMRGAGFSGVSTEKTIYKSNK